MMPQAPSLAAAGWAWSRLPDGAPLWAQSWLVAAGAAAFAAVAILAALVQIRRPVVGLALLLVAGVVAPMEFQRGAGVLSLSLPFAAFICGCFGWRLLRRRGRLALRRSRIVVATLAFGGSAVVSFLVGQYPWFPVDHAPMSAQLVGLGIFLVSAGLLLAVGHQVTTSRQLQRLTWLFLAAGSAAVVTSFVSTFDLIAGPVAISNAGSIGSGFWTWLVAISLSQALLNGGLSPPSRAALAALAAVALLRGLFAAFSWTSGWLPPLVAAGVLLLHRFPRMTLVAGILGVTPALLFAGPAVDAWMAGEAYSSSTRLAALGIMWQVIQHNPWLGFGPANYYYYTQLFPILGWWVPFNSHNNYVDLIGQTGVIGLLLFGWLSVELWWLGRRLRLRVAPGFERSYVMGAMAGLAGSLVSGLLADWIVPFAYNIGVQGLRSSLLFWFFAGGLLALERLRLAPSAATVSAARAR
jgi:O-antigen ligase